MDEITIKEEPADEQPTVEEGDTTIVVAPVIEAPASNDTPDAMVAVLDRIGQLEAKQTELLQKLDAVLALQVVDTHEEPAAEDETIIEPPVLDEQPGEETMERHGAGIVW